MSQLKCSVEPHQCFAFVPQGYPSTIKSNLNVNHTADEAYFSAHIPGTHALLTGMAAKVAVRRSHAAIPRKKVLWGAAGGARHDEPFPHVSMRGKYTIFTWGCYLHWLGLITTGVG